MVSEARRNGPSFEDICPEDREVRLDEIMLRIASICGCALPNTEFFARYIADEIEKYILSFGYAECTVDEIVLAFRINAVSVDHINFTGVCLNVDYIAKVLKAYSEIRKLFENKLKNKIDGYEL
jgi:hypothetical protein